LKKSFIFEVAVVATFSINKLCIFIMSRQTKSMVSSYAAYRCVIRTRLFELFHNSRRM